MGFDGISPRISSLSVRAIAEEVVNLINKFIEQRDWPLEWKRSNVSPIFKKDDSTDKKYYRPVFVLASMEKFYD